MRLDTWAMRSDNWSGYGRMTYELGQGLSRLGVDFGEVPDKDRHGSVAANALFFGAPSHVTGWWEGQKAYVLTMWEATGVPPGFRENVDDFEAIIVPSQQNVELFSKFHPNIKKIRLGIDPKLWRIRKRPEVKQEFRFLCAGNGPRKGIDIATKAFETVFGDFQPSHDHPLPTLTIKDRHMQKGIKRGPQVRENSATLDPQEEADFYATFHCFLGLARGEGWGLMPFQAMAQGMPAILSDAHGHAEFSHLASLPIHTSLEPAGQFIFGDADCWWTPDFDQVCEAMWEMYSNYAQYAQKAEESAFHIHRHYTWDDAAKELLEAMGGPGALSLPDIETGTWHEPPLRKFPVIANKDCSYEVNGVTYVFKRGEEYMVFGDLKRMMFENDRLDPRCLQDPNELGLHPSQLSELELYKARNARCPTCRQHYNSDPDFDADDLG